MDNKDTFTMIVNMVEATTWILVQIRPNLNKFISAWAGLDHNFTWSWPILNPSSPNKNFDLGQPILEFWSGRDQFEIDPDFYLGFDIDMYTSTCCM